MAWLWIPQFGLEVPPKIPNRNSANIQMDYHILSELKSLEGARCEIKMISVWRILIVVIHVFQHGCFLLSQTDQFGFPAGCKIAQH